MNFPKAKQKPLTKFLSLNKKETPADYKSAGVFLFLKRIPFFLDEAAQEHKEHEHIVCNHTSPGGTKIEIEKLGEDKSSENSDSPHSDYVENKRFLRSSDALHKSFDYDEETVERFRNSNHSKNR